MSEITAIPLALAAGAGAAAALSATTSTGNTSIPAEGQHQDPPSYAVRAAVNDLNAIGYVGEGREVTFSVDPGSRSSVVKVVDSQTREVIVQWPARYALQLAEQSRKAQESQDEALLRTTHY